MANIFTAAEVARICNVAPRTVNKWFDAGRLRGYRIPGTMDRRIPFADLLAFLTEHGFPREDLAFRAGRTEVSELDNESEADGDT